MNLHIETLGLGRDLVLLHGWGMHGGVWNSVKEKLAERFRLHILDLPGFGHSAAIAPYTLSHLVESIASQVPENIVLCGWSLGGQVALQWALQRPQQLEKLLLVSATPRFIREPTWEYGIELETFRQFADGVQNDYQPAITRFLSLQAQGGEDARHTTRELKAHFFQRPAPDKQALQAGLQILLDADFRDSAAEIRVPTCVLHGDRDRIAPLAAGEWLAHCLSAELHVCKNASHAPFLSHPAWFLERVTEFLA
ncbi:MAG: pimeloyl-ACP methyl ester esterase BioH [Methylophilaceae bacterium]